MTQAVPLSARKTAGGFSEGIAPFLQLPHFSEAIVKKITRKVRKFLHLQFFALSLGNSCISNNILVYYLH